MEEMVKIVVYVPVTHADAVREALAKGGAGQIGNYDRCSFSQRGTGRFRPMAGSDPFIGTQGSVESVEEERIEAVCPKAIAPDIIQSVRAAHPYEEVAYDVYPLLDL